MARFGPKIDLDNNDRNRKVWFMSDLHFNHNNILRLNARKFKTIDKMNDYILEEIREKVKEGDILFDLGDLIWRESPREVGLFSGILPPRSFRILGNHDSLNLGAWGSCWGGVYDILDLIIKYKGEDIQFVLSHYPILDWNHRYRGSIALHGHCHGMVDEINNQSGELRIDVGFDSSLSSREGSFLIPFETIYREMKEKVGGIKFRSWAKKKYD